MLDGFFLRIILMLPVNFKGLQLLKMTAIDFSSPYGTEATLELKQRIPNRTCSELGCQASIHLKVRKDGSTTQSRSASLCQ